MTSKTKTGANVEQQNPVALSEQERTEQTTQLNNLMSAQERLAALRAEQKRLNDEAKALKASLPEQPKREKLTTEDKLAKLIAYQTSHPMDNFIASKVKQRIALGQDQETAIAEVWALTRDWLVAELSRPTADEQFSAE